jgi:anti-sigma factor RsiW
MNCPEEFVLAAAIAKGDLSEDLRRHLSGCAACSQAHASVLALQQIADEFAAEPAPSAAAMWWRLSLRARREHARRAQQPLLWMTRIAYIAIAALIAFAIAAMPSSTPVFAIGLAALAAAAIPILIALWAWSRSGT